MSELRKSVSNMPSTLTFLLLSKYIIAKLIFFCCCDDDVVLFQFF